MSQLIVKKKELRFSVRTLFEEALRDDPMVKFKIYSGVLITLTPQWMLLRIADRNVN